MKHYPLDLAQLIEERNFDGIIALIVSKIPVIVSAVLILVIGFTVSNFIGKMVIKALKAKGVDPSIHTFIKTCITLILKFAFILSAISTLGINVSSFLAAIGAAGITAGIGLQSSVSQLASGVQILINHPFKSGDFVELGTVSGKVHEIKLMYTVFVTADNKQVIVPNSTITSGNIINYKHCSQKQSYSHRPQTDCQHQGTRSQLNQFRLPPMVQKRRLLGCILLYAGTG